MKASIVAASALVASVAAFEHKNHAGFHMRRAAYEAKDEICTVYTTVYVSAVPSIVPNTTAIYEHSTPAAETSSCTEEETSSVYTPVVVSAKTPEVTQPGYPTVPAVPEASKPAVPEHPSKPAVPEHPSKPAVPEVSKPAVPEVSKPAVPGYPTKPTVPEVSKPAVPEEPASSTCEEDEQSSTVVVSTKTPEVTQPGYPTVPAVPEVSKPTVPEASKPAVPEHPSKPAVPEVSKPSVPEVSKPAVPGYPTKPAVPEVSKPAIPAVSKPASSSCNEEDQTITIVISTKTPEVTQPAYPTAPVVPEVSKPAVPEVSKPSVPEVSKPAVPEYPTKPAVPEVSKPTVPEVTKPAVPEYPTKPVVPEVSKPAVPEVSKPAVPEVSKPAVPEVSKPAVPEYPTKPVETPKPAPSSSKAVDTPKPVPSSSKAVEKPKPTGSYSSGGRIVTNGKKWAMTYTPYAPDGNCKTEADIKSDIKIIADMGFTTIRSYSTDCGVFEYVVPACQEHGLKIIYGIFLEGGGSGGKGPFSEYANKQLEDIKKNAPKDGVAMVIVGNECMFNNNCVPTELASYIDHCRETLQGAGFPKDIAITTTEPVGTWEEKGAALCDHIDVFTVQVHPYFTATISPDMAGDFAAQQLEQAAKVCPEAAAKGKYITEIGWPSAGNSNGLAVAGAAEQKQAMKKIIEKVGSEACLFSFKDDPWKHPGALGVEQHFGTIDALTY